MVYFIQKVLNPIFKKILAIPYFTKIAVFEVRQKYFEDLSLSIDLDATLKCPITEPQALFSFSEIFVERAYDNLWQHIPLPSKWIDLGCHRGYFSLYISAKHKKINSDSYNALLIDADIRSKKWIEAIYKENDIKPHFQYLQRVVSKDEASFSKFGLRFGMVSSNDESLGPVESWISVQKLDVNTIMHYLKPPYDLLKIDIEGAEYTFISDFGPILQKTNNLVLEWHTPEDPQKTKEAINKSLAKWGLFFKAELQPSRKIDVNGTHLWTGVALWSQAVS